eukprot:CCRYP_007071-RB/>CCRYP_007071-RB protein AED:0.16 eAED:0.16 QI:187/-1/1/1/-1/1/1/56/1032
MKKSLSAEFQPAKLPAPQGPARSRRKHPTPTDTPPDNSTPQLIQTNFHSRSKRTSLRPNDNLSSSQNSDGGSCIAASVVFADYDDTVGLFDEIDALDPHEKYEGGDLIDGSSRSAPGIMFPSSSVVVPTTAMMGSSLGRSQASLTASSRSPLSSSGMTSHFSSNFASVQSSSAGHFVPTDYDTLMKSTNDGSLAEMMAGLEERYYNGEKFSDRSNLKLSNILEKNSLMGSGSSTFFDEEVLMQVHKSLECASVVGGKEISEMSLEEQREVLGRSTHSLFEDEYSHELKILSSVDWSSLNKSCKCAKNAFRDADYSGQMVVKNMFLKHLDALTAMLHVYTGSSNVAMDKIASLTTDTKRALRFGLSCLSPPRENDSEPSPVLSSMTQPASIPIIGSDFRDDVERYRSGRRFRQELQEAAVKSDASGEEHNRLGLHLPLVDIVLGTRPTISSPSAVSPSVQKNQYTTQVLAARMLCNLVTDNPVTAEIVLMDVPFGPTNEETERRMSMPFNGDPLKNSNIVLCWSDLVAATSKLGNNVDPDREALAAVSAALHNLLASLETRDSLIELDNELRRREQMKGRRARAVRAHLSSSFVNSTSDDESSATKPTDAGFDAVYNRQLMNALLRNILPAHAVIIESRSVASGEERMGRPKFQAPLTANDHSHSFGDTSDSATEWISLVLERMASRGLLPQMFQSAGGVRGKSVTPEQVVLISCIRQAVDDYHTARSPSGEIGEFGRRRLSIAAKSAGVTTLSRPHPLWGRVNEDFGGGSIPLCSGELSGNAMSESTALTNSSIVPVLLFLGNELDRLYLHAKSLHSNPSELLYDGEMSCTERIIDDIRDIIAQCLGRHNTTPNEKNRQCTLPDARSVLGRETSIIKYCLFDLAELLDSALAKNSGKNARDLHLTPQEQHSAIVMVRLVANIVYNCRYNQDILRIVPIPSINPSNGGNPGKRVGLHVILSSTSLAPTCLSLREWCIVAIRNAVEGNDANAEAVRLLEAQNALGDTPELRRMGVKLNLDAKGKVHVQKRDVSD